MSEAVELYKKDGTAAGIFFCSECLAVFAKEDDAKYCHGVRLCACGEKADHYYSQCQKCTHAKFLKEEEEKERERFEKAAKIAPSEYTGDHVFCGEKYFETVEDACCDDAVPPSYMWACKNVGVPKAELEDLTCNIIDSMWEDADASDLSGIDELEAAIAAFNVANESIKVYQPDYSTAIVIWDGR